MPVIKSSQNEKSKKFFEKLPVDEFQKNQYKCNINECGKIVKATNLYSLVSHLKHSHHQIYNKEINPQATNLKSIAMKKMEFIQNCAQMITVNGRPFAIFRDSGFQNITKPLLDELKENGQGINLNDQRYPEIFAYIAEAAKKIKTKIINELNGRLVSVMADIGTRHDKSLFGISLQYVIDGKIITRCIGMMHIRKRHQSLNLKEMLEDKLNEYGIKSLQVVAFTTDNGSNVKKMVKLFSDDIAVEFEGVNEESDEVLPEESEAAEVIQNNEYTAEITYSFSTREIESLIEEYNNDEISELNELLYNDDDNSYDELIESMESDIAHVTTNIERVPCSAHTLQLAVMKAMEPFQTIVKLCRTAAKMLRRQVFVYELLAAGFRVKRIRLDSTVRWSSIRRMLDDLVKCEAEIRFLANKNDESIFKAVLFKWDVIKEILEILDVPHEVTLAVQKASFALSDFYGCWLKIQIKLKKLCSRTDSITNLAQELLNAMNEREQQLLQHPTMNAAIFMDPRFHCDLTNDQKRDAKMKLSMLREKHQHVQSIFREGEADMNLNDDGFKQLLNDYEKDLPRLHHSVSILDFWAGRIKTSIASPHFINIPQLRIVAFIVLGIPSTQVPCERAFSQVNFIYSDRRMLLGQEKLEQIMLLRTNSDLFEILKDEELKRINAD